MTDYPPPPYQGAPSTPPSAAPYQPPTPSHPASYPAYGTQPSEPSQGLAIAGLVLAFVAAPVGLILSIVAAVKLNKQGGSKGVAVTGIVVGAILTLLALAVIVFAAVFFGNIIAVCSEFGPGVWTVDGITYTCGGG